MTPNALPDVIRVALDDYGIVCANVVKGRTSPEAENMAREKVEAAIGTALSDLRDRLARLSTELDAEALAVAAAQQHIAALTRAGDGVTVNVATLYELINDLADADECEHDHHGYCQTHGWMTTERECPHARAAKVLPEVTTDA